MCSACMTICPSASNSAVEASRRSLMFDECAERISTAPISSQAARSAPVDDLQLDRVERRSAPRGAQADRAVLVDLAATSPAGPAAWPLAARTAPARYSVAAGRGLADAGRRRERRAVEARSGA